MADLTDEEFRNLSSFGRKPPVPQPSPTQQPPPTSLPPGWSVFPGGAQSPPLSAGGGYAPSCGQSMPSPEQLPEVRETEPLPILPSRETWRQWPQIKIRWRPLEKLRITEEMLPPGPVYHRYNEFMKPVGTLLEHNWACCTALIATALGPYWRMRTIDGVDLRPNIFVALVASSSSGKGLNSRGVKDACPEHLFTDTIPKSSVAFIESLKSGQSMLWWLHEAGSLFSQFSGSFQTDTPTIMTQTYDGENVTIARKGHDEVKAAGPCLNLIFATVEKGLIPPKEHRPQDLFTQGLFSRFFFCPSERAVGDVLELPRARDQIYKEAFRRWLLQVEATKPTTSGRWHQLKLSQDALQEYRIWLHGRGEAPNEVLAGSWGRGMPNVAKLAVIYHAAQGLNPWIPISADTTLRAIKTVHEYLLPAHLALAMRAGQDELQSLSEHLYEDLLRSNTGLMVADLGRTHRIWHQRLATLLANMGEILVYSKWTPRGYGGKTGRARLVVSLRDRAVVRPGEDCLVPPGYTDPPNSVLKLLRDLNGDNE